MFVPLLLIPLGLITAAATSRVLQPRKVILRAGKSYRITLELVTSATVGDAELQELAGALAAQGYRDVLVTRGRPILVLYTEEVRQSRVVTIGKEDRFDFAGTEVQVILKDVE